MLHFPSRAAFLARALSNGPLGDDDLGDDETYGLRPAVRLAGGRSGSGAGKVE
jgi:hypothetical protein